MECTLSLGIRACIFIAPVTNLEKQRLLKHAGDLGSTAEQREGHKPFSLFRKCAAPPRDSKIWGLDSIPADTKQ